MKLKFSSTGFTLIELLITITIFAVLAAVAIPNIRQFSESEELNNTIDDFVRIVRLAQSSAMSSINCNGLPSSSWTVDFTDSVTDPTKFNLKCLTSTWAIHTPYTKEFDEDQISVTSSSCDPWDSVELVFSRNSVTFRCDDNSISGGSFVIQFSKGSDTRDVTIGSGGTISVTQN